MISFDSQNNADLFISMQAVYIQMYKQVSFGDLTKIKNTCLILSLQFSHLENQDLTNPKLH